MALQVSEDERAVVQRALQNAGILAEDLEEFEADDLDCLFRGGYKSAKKLQSAVYQGLTACGLKPASISFLLQRLPGRTATGGAAVEGHVEEDECMTTLLQSILDGTEDDNFLVFKPCQFPGGSKVERTMLYVREDYKKVYDLMVEIAEKHDLCLSGSRGIGKTWYAIYAVRRRLLDKPDAVVIWESRHSSSERFLFKGRTAYVGDLNSFKKELQDPNTWQFVDGKMPDGKKVKARVIMVVSGGHTQRKDVKDWILDTAAHLVLMPPPTCEEVEVVYNKLYRDKIDRPRYQQLLALYGPVFRRVLDLPGAGQSVHVDEQAAVEAISSCKLLKVKESLRSQQGIPQKGDDLLLIIPTENYRKPAAIRFASKQLWKAFLVRLQHEQRDQVLALLRHLDNEGDHRGIIYETACHRDFIKTNTYVLEAIDRKPLQSINQYGIIINAARKTLTMEACGREVKFGGSSLEDMVCTWEENGCPMTYCVPAITNFKAIDSVRLGNVMFQITVKKQKTLDWELLHKVLQQLDREEQEEVYHLVYVVPKKAMFKVKFGTCPRNLLKLKDKVRVYVMEVPCEDSSKTPSPQKLAVELSKEAEEAQGSKKKRKLDSTAAPAPAAKRRRNAAAGECSGGSAAAAANRRSSSRAATTAPAAKRRLHRNAAAGECSAGSAAAAANRRSSSRAATTAATATAAVKPKGLQSGG